MAALPKLGSFRLLHVPSMVLNLLEPMVSHDGAGVQGQDSAILALVSLSKNLNPTESAPVDS